MHGGTVKKVRCLCLYLREKSCCDGFRWWSSIFEGHRFGSGRKAFYLTWIVGFECVGGSVQ